MAGKRMGLALVLAIAISMAALFNPSEALLKDYKRLFFVDQDDLNPRSPGMLGHHPMPTDKDHRYLGLVPVNEIVQRRIRWIYSFLMILDRLGQQQCRDCFPVLRKERDPEWDSFIVDTLLRLDKR